MTKDAHGNTRDQLRGEVEATRVELNRLLWVAKHSRMQAELELALRELEDARVWLHDPKAEGLQSVLDLAARGIEMARSRLNMIDRAVTTRDIDQLFFPFE
jgi:hypothetical protein